MHHIFRSVNLFPAVIAGIFIALAGKIAFVRQFPLPYDEYFHVGLIRLYTHHLNPFLGSQPAGGDAYGAVARDPSYLYHYLMSFPMRLFQAAGLNDFGQVIALRSLNIALGLSTLYFMYKLGRRLGLSVWAARLVTLALAVTPVFYDVAAQVNYDNLLVLISVLTVLATLRLREAIQVGKLPFGQLAYFVVLLIVGTLVKYSFLPIALTVVLYLGWQIVRNLRVRAMPATLKAGFTGMAAGKRLLIISLVVVTGAAWVQRYGVNLAVYHTPHPQCHIVLSVQECSAYGPWARNYQLHETIAQRPFAGLHFAHFTLTWSKMMLTEPFSIVYNTPAAGGLYAMNLPLLAGAGVLLAGAGLVIVLRFRRCMRGWIPGLLVFSGVYCAFLWAQNYSDFNNLHEIIAVQGRYLLPVLPAVYTAIGLAYAVAAESASLTALRDLGLQWRRRTAAGILEITTSLSALPRLQTWPPINNMASDEVFISEVLDPYRKTDR